MGPLSNPCLGHRPFGLHRGAAPPGSYADSPGAAERPTRGTEVLLPQPDPGPRPPPRKILDEGGEDDEDDALAANRSCFQGLLATNASPPVGLGRPPPLGARRSGAFGGGMALDFHSLLWRKTNCFVFFYFFIFPFPSTQQLSRAFGHRRSNAGPTATYVMSSASPHRVQRADSWLWSGAVRRRPFFLGHTRLRLWPEQFSSFLSGGGGGGGEIVWGALCRAWVDEPRAPSRLRPTTANAGLGTLAVWGAKWVAGWRRYGRGMLAAVTHACADPYTLFLFPL